MHKFNEKGFSLVQVLVAAGMLGGLAVLSLQLTKNVVQNKMTAQNDADLMELKTSVRMILDHPDYARISLAGTKRDGTPALDIDGVAITKVEFVKTDVDNDDGLPITKGTKYTKDNEGIEVELWLSSQDGTRRTQKMFNGSESLLKEPDKSKFGNITIKYIRLVFTNGNIDFNDNMPFNDRAQLVLLLETKMNKGTTRESKEIFPINVTGQTTAGKSVLLGSKRAILPFEDYEEIFLKLEPTIFGSWNGWDTDCAYVDTCNGDTNNEFGGFPETDESKKNFTCTDVKWRKKRSGCDARVKRTIQHGKAIYIYAKKE